MPVLAPTHRRARRRRWAAVALVAAVLVVLGVLGLPRTSSAEPPTPERLLERVAASADVPHTGTAVSTGTLGLPDLPRLGGVASVLGSTTRTRVLWASEQRWRVDVLRATGERGTYVGDGRTTTWDYEDREVTTAPVTDTARLPRPDDLLPPRLARALVVGASARPGAALRAAGLGAGTVAGRVADGVRLTEPDQPEQPEQPAEVAQPDGPAVRGTLDHADVWVDRASGLPLEVVLVDRAGTPTVTARFDTVALEPPSDAALVPPAPPGADVDAAEPDLAGAVDEFAPWRLPAELAGLPALADDVTEEGVLAYGSGLTRLALVPLPPDLGARAVQVARAAGGPDLAPAGAEPDDEVVLLRAGALTAALVRAGDDRHSYLLAGSVEPELLEAAAGQLLADPPAWRR